jgi:hypothetical protein
MLPLRPHPGHGRSRKLRVKTAGGSGAVQHERLTVLGSLQLSHYGQPDCTIWLAKNIRAAHEQKATMVGTPSNSLHQMTLTENSQVDNAQSDAQHNQVLVVGLHHQAMVTVSDK